MTGEQFCKWLDEMKASGLAKSDAQCAKMLGIHPVSLVKRKTNGAKRETALACRALLHRIQPYS